MMPKWTPKSTKNRLKIDLKTDAQFECILASIFGRFWSVWGPKTGTKRRKIDLKSFQNRSKIDPKSIKNRSGSVQGVPGRSRGARGRRWDAPGTLQDAPRSPQERSSDAPEPHREVLGRPGARQERTRKASERVFRTLVVRSASREASEAIFG